MLSVSSVDSVAAQSGLMKSLKDQGINSRSRTHTAKPEVVVPARRDVPVAEGGP